LKGECIDHRPWPTHAMARCAVVDYIAWYNGSRIHSTLGCLTPAEYEAATDQDQHHLAQVA
jgi:putative transposase